MKNRSKFVSFLTKFRVSDDGAVTTDYVVITGAIVGLGLGVLLSVSGGASDLADGVSDVLKDIRFEAADPMEGPPPTTW